MNEFLDILLNRLQEAHDRKFKFTTFTHENGVVESHYNISPDIEYISFTDLVIRTSRETPKYHNAIVLAIDFLNKKELIKIKNINNDNHYAITFEGLKKLEKGGFNGMALAKINALRANNQRENALMYGTWLAGVGAILLVTIEILKKWGWVGTIEALTLWIFLGIGVLTGLCITQLMKSE